MYPTKNDLPETTRRQMIDLCNARLADAIDLQTQTKQAHWNVKGPHFIALHELFDKVNEDVEDYVDLIAERAVQLGGGVEGTARSVAKRSTLPEYPVKAGSGRQQAPLTHGCWSSLSWTRPRHVSTLFTREHMRKGRTR